MTSKVLVKLPVQAFTGNPQVSKNKSNASDLVASGRSTDVRSTDSSTSRTPSNNTGMPTNSAPSSYENGNSNRVAQHLEQNIKHLQEQHQQMLSGLHHEIDVLRHRNRELQFQLVFSKGANISTPSSPEDEKLKLYSNSPRTLNITPLQVEILEKELGEMKIQLQESECRNVYLSAIVDEQKKKLERYERDRERERERGIQPDPELIRKLDDAETLIRRLRRENSDLRHENAYQQPSQQTQAPREYQQGARSGGQRRRGGGHSSNTNGSSGSATNSATPGGSGNQFRPNWFPPLHTTNYWQQQSRPQQSHVDSLPQLQSAANPHLVYPQQGHQGHSRRGNNNHFGERKYRGNNHQNRGQKST